MARRQRLTVTSRGNGGLEGGEKKEKYLDARLQPSPDSSSGRGEEKDASVN